MKTPCQTHDDPDLWTSENAQDRREAAIACGPCPVKAACLADATGNGITWGVWGGREFGKHGAGQPLPQKTCAHCGQVFTKPRDANMTVWHARRFCNRQCAGLAKRNNAQTKTCGECGHEFRRTYQSAEQWEGQRFCGHKCGGRAALKTRQGKAA